MAESVDRDSGDGGDDSSEPISIFRQLTVEQIRRGTTFTADIEQDFELDELYLSDEGSDTDDISQFGAGSEASAKAVNLYTPPLFEGLADACQNVTPDGGVKKLVLREGSGIKPPAGGKLYFDYVAFIADQPEHFDASARNGGMGVELDEKCGLIKGLRLGLASMEYSEVAQFLVQPDYAYGKMGCPPRIPAEAEVIFNVRFVKFLTLDQLKDPLFMTKDQRSKLDFKEIYEAAMRVREKANSHFSNNSYHKAVRIYRSGIDLLENYWKVNDQQVLERGNLLACLYCNLAQCYVQLKKGPQACNACKNGLKQPDAKYKAKLLFRFAKAKFLVESYSDALGYLEKARMAGAPKATCDQLRQEIIEADESDQEMLSKMYKAMMLARK